MRRGVPKMTFVDRPLPEALKLSPLRDARPRDKRLNNLRNGPGTGRVKGIQNKICRDLKEGLLQGAILHGYDGTGEGGLVGYCLHIAERHPNAYCGLLGKLLPLNLNANTTSAGIQTVRIISVPAGTHYSAADLERLEQGQTTIDALPQPERAEDPAQPKPALIEEATPRSSEDEDRIINDLRNEINGLAQKLGVSVVV